MTAKDSQPGVALIVFIAVLTALVITITFIVCLLIAAWNRRRAERDLEVFIFLFTPFWKGFSTCICILWPMLKNFVNPPFQQFFLLAAQFSSSFYFPYFLFIFFPFLLFYYFVKFFAHKRSCRKNEINMGIIQQKISTENFSILWVYTLKFFNICINRSFLGYNF